MTIAKDCIYPFKGPMPKRITISKKKRFFSNPFYYDLECVSEAESAPIRFRSIFCFDLDVRFFSQLFQKIFFRSIQKYFARFWGNFSKIGQHFRISLSCMLLHIENLKEIRKFCLIFENPPKSDKIFLDRSKKYFLEKL